MAFLPFDVYNVVVNERRSTVDFVHMLAFGQSGIKFANRAYANSNEHALLMFIVSKYQQYYTSDPDSGIWQCDNHDLLTRPWEHVYRTGALSCMIVSVFHIRREACTYFITLQTWNGVSRVVIYTGTPLDAPRCLQTNGDYYGYQALIENITEFFSREAFDVPRMRAACDVLDAFRHSHPRREPQGNSSSAPPKPTRNPTVSPEDISVCKDRMRDFVTNTIQTAKTMGRSFKEQLMYTLPDNETGKKSIYGLMCLSGVEPAARRKRIRDMSTAIHPDHFTGSGLYPEYNVLFQFIMGRLKEERA